MCLLWSMVLVYGTCFFSGGGGEAVYGGDMLMPACVYMFVQPRSHRTCMCQCTWLFSYVALCGELHNETTLSTGWPWSAAVPDEHPEHKRELLTAVAKPCDYDCSVNLYMV